MHRAFGVRCFMTGSQSVLEPRKPCRKRTRGRSFESPSVTCRGKQTSQKINKLHGASKTRLH